MKDKGIKNKGILQRLTDKGKRLLWFVLIAAMFISIVSVRAEGHEHNGDSEDDFARIIYFDMGYGSTDYLKY